MPSLDMTNIDLIRKGDKHVSMKKIQTCFPLQGIVQSDI